MQPVIALGERPEPAERHAAADLRRYLHQLTGALATVVEGDPADAAPVFRLGTARTHPAVARLLAAGTVPTPTAPESYTVTTVDGGVVVAGADAQGVQYGTYRLLEQYGARFYLNRDVLPPRVPFTVPDVALDERPAVPHRGLLPWHDFLCGPSGYDVRDLRRYVDQMVKMRMNLLVLHNYAGGYPGRDIDEPFMSFTHQGVGYDGYLDTSVDNQRWGLAPTRAGDMAFRAGDLMPFDVMASDAARATREQDDARAHTFAKAKTMMRQAVEYAQRRGVEVMLGTDFDLVPLPLVEAGCDPLAPGTLAARIDDVVATYPTLHYLQMYYSESHDVTTAQAIEAYTFMRDYLAEVAPNVRLVTGSWFQEERFAEMHAALPGDVTFASLLPHDLTVKPDWAKAVASGRTAWAIPWVEIDGGLSEPQLAVRRMQDQLPLLREAGVDAVVGILWRERAVEANVAYLAADAWASTSAAATDADTFYRDYASTLFGAAAADEAAALFRRVEDAGVYGVPTTTNQFPLRPEPSGMTTPEFGTWFLSGDPHAPDRAERWRALADAMAALAPSARDAAAVDELDHWTQTLRWMQHYWSAHADVPAAAEHTDPAAAWQALGDSAFRPAIDAYRHTVRDLTALGGLVSAAGGRWYYTDPPPDPDRANAQFHVYERAVRARLDVQPPHALRAYGTPTGAELTWTTYSGAAQGGCHVYRAVDGGDPVRVTREPVTSGRFTDVVDGQVRYTVTTVAADGAESLPSFPDTVAAGDAPVTASLVIMPTPGTAVRGEPFAVAATFVSDRRPDDVTGVLHYRPLGADTWRSTAMRRHVAGRPSTFHGEVPGDVVTADGVEYHVTVGPATGATYTVVGTEPPDAAPGRPRQLELHRRPGGVHLTWRPADGDPWLYRVYRGDTGVPHPAEYLTYVPATHPAFLDTGGGSTGGYTVVAVSRRGVAGAPATARL